MNSNGRYEGEPSGPIAYMARNGVAANLLMWAVVAAGLLSLGGIVMQAWPTLPFNHIEVSVAYPGASPEEVEESIVVKIEERVSALEKVRKVKSSRPPASPPCASNSSPAPMSARRSTRLPPPSARSSLSQSLPSAPRSGR